MEDQPLSVYYFFISLSFWYITPITTHDTSFSFSPLPNLLPTLPFPSSLFQRESSTSLFRRKTPPPRSTRFKSQLLTRTVSNDSIFLGRHPYPTHTHCLRGPSSSLVLILLRTYHSSLKTLHLSWVYYNSPSSIPKSNIRYPRPFGNFTKLFLLR